MTDFRVINGIRVFGFTSKEELINFSKAQKKILIAVNAEKIYNSTQELKDVINKNIGYSDGVGAVWALNQKGIKNVVKIPGVELWLEFVKRNYKSHSFYFIGAREEILQATITKLKSEFPEISIVGFRNGYFNEAEREVLIQDVITKKPGFVFVAMGSPTQEKLMCDLEREHPCVYLGLGGSFDVYSGNTKRAPQLFIDLKLEWFYRLISEPKRAFRQVKLVDFTWKMLLKKY
tara:strand:- start:3265 stop:3963 length:699 start_codon:yes stop_codon:yes gene_type:complete